MFSIFFNMKVYCVFSLEYTQYHFQYEKKKNTLNSKSAAMRFFPKGLKNDFEPAVVNEPSVFEPLKFYCIILTHAVLESCCKYASVQ